MKIGATFEDHLTAKLLALPSATSFEVRTKALVEGAEPIRAEAERRAPRQTGALAVNIVIDPFTQGEIDRGVDWKGDEAAVAVGPNVPHFYGYFREFGTVKEPARPWFRPAVEAMAGVAMRIVLGRLWDGIRAAAAGGTSSLPKNVGTVGSRNL